MKNKNRIIIMILLTILIVVGFGYWFYKGDTDANGKLYSSKEKLCIHFAQSYLRTIQKTDSASPDSQKWEMGVNIETDFYNLCMLNLDKESLMQFKSTVIEKYQK